MYDVKISPELVEQLEELVRNLGLDPDDALRWRYSGRVMYGATCLGFVGDTGELVGFVLALGDLREVVRGSELGNELDAVLELMRLGTRYDSLDMNTVYYWPRVGRS